MLKCSLCEEMFLDEDFLQYGEHVTKCVQQKKKETEALNVKKMNEQLEELKRMKGCYEGMRDDFKKKYPDVYALNFKDDCSCNGNCSCGSHDKSDKNKFIDLLNEFGYSVRMTN